MTTRNGRIDRGRRSVLRTLGAGALVGLAGLGSVGGATAAGHVRTVATFGFPGVPENIAVDPRGNVYLGLTFTGEVWKLPPGRDPGDAAVVATLPLPTPDSLVLAVDVLPNGTLYATRASLDGSVGDLVRIDRDGTWTVVADFGGAVLANDVVQFGDDLLVSDSFGGEVLRVTPDGTVTTWLSDPLLAPVVPNPLGLPVGPNGLAVAADGSVAVANTTQGSIVTVPVDGDGNAGTPSALVDPALVGADGIAYDTKGNLLVAVIAQNAVVSVTPAGSVTSVLGAGDGLEGPSDVAFGTGRRERRTLFVVNFAFGTFVNPSLLATDWRWPGLPVWE